MTDSLSAYAGIGLELLRQCVEQSVHSWCEDDDTNCDGCCAMLHVTRYIGRHRGCCRTSYQQCQHNIEAHQLQLKPKSQAYRKRYEEHYGVSRAYGVL